MQSDSISQRFDIAIIGGGILGVTISYWLSNLYDCSILLVDKEKQVAMHTTSRNTGIIHRPFYLNPEKRRLFARASQKSYFLWKDLAQRYNLTWKPIGTLEVAKKDEQISTLDQYKQWAIKNGMKEEEVEILDAKRVQEVEPEVKCAGAIFSKTDTCVNYAEFTNFLFERARKNGVTFLGGSTVQGASEDEEASGGIQIKSEDGKVSKISADFVINAAGGGSVSITHQFGLGKEYADLCFRGEYWRVDEPFASKISKNIYSVPEYKEFPFLDPHFIVRANGTREIGPNAVLVFGPAAYKGLSEKRSQVISKIFERPIVPKVKLFTSGTFLSLVLHEWQSSVSKSAMCARVRKFVPQIDVSYLKERGVAGVRSSVIDGNGFVPEAILLSGDRSFHILNYNSPGATGAPAFSAYVVSKLIGDGHFDGKKRRDSESQFWDFEEASDL